MDVPPLRFELWFLREPEPNVRCLAVSLQQFVASNPAALVALLINLPAGVDGKTFTEGAPLPPDRFPLYARFTFAGDAPPVPLVFERGNLRDDPVPAQAFKVPASYKRASTTFR